MAGHDHDHAAAGRRRGSRPGLRHDGRSGQDAAPRRARRADLSLLRRGLPDQVPGRSRTVAEQGRRPSRAGGRARGAGRDHLHLPHAPADPPGGAGVLSRSAAWRWSRRRSPPRRRPIPSLRTCAGGSGSGWCWRPRWCCWRWAGIWSTSAPGSRRRRRPGSSSPSPRRWCCGRARRFFAKAWASLLRRKLNMFTLIAMGVTASYGDSVLAVVRARRLPALHARTRRRARRSISRRRRRSPCWCCWARCWSWARASAPPAPSAP